MLIKYMFVLFLKEQKERLANKTYRDYESVIDLFDYSLDGFAWDTLDDDDPTYEEVHDRKLTFIDVFDHTHILDNVGEFLNYFVPRKVAYGDEFTLKTCPRIVRKLLKWMVDKNLIDIDNKEIKEVTENQTWEESVKQMGF